MPLPSPLWQGERPLRSFYTLVLLAGIAIFTCGLCGYIVTGLNARYVQDDYCYAAILGRQGFWEGQLRSFLEETTYNGNRFSLTFFMGVSESLGRFSVGMLPGLVIILWVAGLILALSNASRCSGSLLTWIEILFLAEAVVFLTLSQAPNLAQVLYWRPGMLPYLAPLVTQAYLVAAVLGAVSRRKAPPLFLAGVTLLALGSAGFSETAAAFQAGLCSLTVFATWLGLRVKKPAAWVAFHSSLAALGGTLAGMILLIISPAGRRMQAMHYGAAQSIPHTLLFSLDSMSYFVKYTLYRVTVPTFFTFAFFFILGLLAFPWNKLPRNAFRRPGLSFAISAGVVVLLLACIMAPSAYVQGAYPELRALIGARLVVVLWLAALGLYCGSLARQQLDRRRLEVLYLGAAGMLLSALILLVYFIAPGSLQLPAYPDIRTFAGDSTLMFILVPLLGLACGLGLGFLLRRLQPGRDLIGFILLVVLAVLLLLQPLKAARSIYAELPGYQQRAALWDQRDSEIRQAEEAGLRNIKVRAIDSLAGVSELQENPGNWINRCAAWLYGMESISAVP